MMETLTVLPVLCNRQKESCKATVYEILLFSSAPLLKYITEFKRLFAPTSFQNPIKLKSVDQMKTNTMHNEQQWQP